MSNASFVSPVVKDGSTLSVISPNNFCDSLAASSENSFVLCSISFLTSATVDLVSIIFGSSSAIANQTGYIFPPSPSDNNENEVVDKADLLVNTYLQPS